MKLNAQNREYLKEQKKELLIITDIDLDGISGAVLASLWFPLATIYSTRTDIVGEFIDSGRIYEFTDVMFIDCSPKTRDEFNSILEIFGIEHLFIFDHHQSLFDMLPKQYINKFNIELRYCATYILYNTLYLDNNYWDGRIEGYCRLVDTYDRWLDKDNENSFLDAKTLNMKLSYLGEHVFKARLRNYLLGSKELDVIPSNLKDGFIYYMESISKYIEKKCNEAYIIGDEAITFAEEYKSEIANQLLNRYKGKIKRGIVVDVSKNSVSIRSKDGSALDKANKISYLSGGHENASGARLDGLKKEIIDMIANK